jgi:putative transposase
MAGMSACTDLSKLRRLDLLLETCLRSNVGSTVRTEFNKERPHEALDLQTPASLYIPSSREMPSKLPPLIYPDRLEVRYVSADGSISWNSGWLYVSSVCSGEYVGLEEFDDGFWSVYFGTLKFGRLDERLMRIENDYGRLNRH